MEKHQLYMKSAYGLRGRTLRKNVDNHKALDVNIENPVPREIASSPPPSELASCTDGNPSGAECQLSSNKDLVKQAVVSAIGAIVFPMFVFPDSWFGDDLCRGAIGAFISDVLYLSFYGSEKELKCLYNKVDFVANNPITILVDTALAAGTLLWMLDFADIGEILEVLLGFENTGTFAMIVSFLALITTDLAVAVNSLRISSVFLVKSGLRLCPVCVPTENEKIDPHHRENWWKFDKKSGWRAWSIFATDIAHMFIAPFESLVHSFLSGNVQEILLAGFNAQSAIMLAIAQVIFDIGTMFNSDQSNCCKQDCCEPDCFTQKNPQLCIPSVDPSTGQTLYAQNPKYACPSNKS